MLGAIVEGMPLQGGKYLGGAFAWFSPFSMLTAVAVVFGYALLGSTWLIMKTDGALQNVAFALTRPLVVVVVAFMGLVSTWLPFLSSQVMARWFESGNFVWLSPVPLLALANAVWLWQAVVRRADYMPFILALSFFALGFVGLVLGIWPNLLPPDLSIWEAAAPPESQGFVLAGTLIMLPAVLGYTWWSYSVFRGKVRLPPTAATTERSFGRSRSAAALTDQQTTDQRSEQRADESAAGRGEKHALRWLVVTAALDRRTAAEFLFRFCRHVRSLPRAASGTTARWRA
jgi:cytochrome bd-type quinol oxidase subunit 2